MEGFKSYEPLSTISRPTAGRDGRMLQCDRRPLKAVQLEFQYQLCPCVYYEYIYYFKPMHTR
jgi:hypothetical protein